MKFNFISCVGKVGIEDIYNEKSFYIRKNNSSVKVSVNRLSENPAQGICLFQTNGNTAVIL